MLASLPASMLNQNKHDLGIPNRFRLNSSRSSTSAHQRCHPTRRASRVDLPLKGRWGNIVAVVVKSEMARLLRQRIFSSEIRFAPFGPGRRRKFNGSHTRNARFSVAYGRASAQFRCCLTRFAHPLTRTPSRPP